MRGEIDTDTKMFLFGRWMATNYSSYTMNSESGYWWKDKLKHFNDIVYPNYVKNGSVKETKKFLKENK